MCYDCSGASVHCGAVGPIDVVKIVTLLCNLDPKPYVSIWVQMQAVELLLVLGQIHEAAGAPLTALPYVLSCLLHSTDLHMDILVCYVLDT